MDVVAYYGAIRRRNVGDVAIYEAAERLLDPVLVDGHHAQSASASLVGGGTVLPHVVYPEGEHGFQPQAVNAVLGAGVVEPAFKNRRVAPLDLRYYLGRCGLNTRRLVDSAPKPVRVALNQVSFNVPGLELHRYYVRPRDWAELRSVDFDVLTVRGPRSRNVLHDWGLDAEVVGDTALALEPPETSRAPGRVVVSLRRPGAPGWGGRHDAVRAVRAFCESTADTFDFVFLPLHPGDIPVSVELADRIPGGEFVDCATVPDVDEVLRVMARAEFIVGEPLHASVLSAAAHTPFVAIEYEPKHTDFARAIGMSEWTIRRDQLTAEILAEHVERLRSSGTLRQRLQTAVAAKRRQLRRTADRIVDLL